MAVYGGASAGDAERAAAAGGARLEGRAGPPPAASVPAQPTSEMTLDVDTENTMEYRFYPVSSQALKFSVRCPNDAHICLTSGPAEANPMYEIFIGGWQNSKSVIRKNREKPDVYERETPGILNGSEFRTFWITFYNKVIAVGQNDDTTPLLVWSDPDLYNVTYYGIRTSWGASGSWRIEDSWSGWLPPQVQNVIGWNVQGVGSGAGTWVNASGDAIPPNAVVGGYDNEQLYVGRATHKGDVIPGKVHPSHNVCYVSWGGVEIGVPEFQVLCDCSGTWVKVVDNNIPHNAIEGGVTESQEPLYIGRAEHNGTLTVGKVQKSHGVCYIPYGGQEISKTEYEVLVTP